MCVFVCEVGPLRANRDRQAAGGGSFAASESPSSASASASASASGSSGVSDTAADDPLACLAACGAAAAAAAAAAASGGGCAHPIASSACSVASSELLPSALAHVPSVDPAAAAMAMASSDALASAAGAAGLPFLLSCLPALLRGLGSPAPAPTPANLSLPPSERLLQLAADSLASSNATSCALVPPAPLLPVSAAAALLRLSALGAAAPAPAAAVAVAGSEPLDLSVHANNVSPKPEENGAANGIGAGTGAADDPQALLGRLLVALSAANPLLKSPIAPSPFEDLIASAVYA